MRFAATLPTVWPFSAFGYARLVCLDADEIIETCGVSAIEAAEINSTQEDLGLLSSPRPGHWDRVAREIKRRSGRPNGERGGNLHVWTFETEY